MRTPLTPDRLAELDRHLSPARLARYLKDTGGDRVAAIALYEWNMAVAEAFYSPLQSMEVVLRNALGGPLMARFGADWYVPGKVKALQYPLPDMLADAQRKIGKRGAVPDHGLMLAELNFGFWSGILSKRYETDLWRPLFHKQFAHAGKITRAQVHAPVDQLRLFRNRIAHHEPIYSRALADDYAAILQVAGWISPFMATWIDETSRVAAVLAAKP